MIYRGESCLLSLKSRILELGCGTGILWFENINRIREGWNIALSDLSLWMLQETQRNLKANSRHFKFAVTAVYCKMHNSENNITKYKKEKVNYDLIAPTYNQRFTAPRYEGIVSKLSSLAQGISAKRLLDVGCGTGHWLSKLKTVVPEVFGLDLSMGMLRQALQRKEQFFLTRGEASQLPFREAVFDLICCVNALHHFERPDGFISEARRLLRPGGMLAITGMNPHIGRICWYLYDYFEGTYETDLRRFPSVEMILDWMVTAGFDEVEWQVADRVVRELAGREVLKDPFLQKTGTSQLALLTEGAYATGISRIKAAIEETEAVGETLIFPVDITFPMVIGCVKEYD